MTDLRAMSERPLASPVPLGLLADSATLSHSRVDGTDPAPQDE